MNTFLSSQQEAIRENYKSFAQEHVLPLVKGLETHSVCLKDFLHNMGQKGYLGLSVPKEFGGQGLEFMYCAFLAEALGYYEPGLGLSIANHFAVIEVLKKYGSSTQKSRFLPLLARGETLATLAFSESKAGTDYKAVESALKAESGGSSYILNAEKIWVVNGEISQLALVLAKSPEGAADPLSMVLADLSQSKPDCGADAHRLGLRSAYLNSVKLSEHKLSKEALLENSSEKTEKLAAFALDTAKVVLAASAVGLLYGAMDAALKHARSREQFGSTIGQFQGIQWKLADMYAEGEGARLQVYRAAWSLEGETEKFATYAAMSKYSAGQAARKHASEALQILGASGMLEDLPLEKFYRDAKAMEIYFGTSEGQKLQLVEELKI